MALHTAILLGFAFFFCRLGIIYTWPKNSALFGAMLIGLIMGDLPHAMIIGAAVQAIYMGVIQPGGNIPTDEAMATFVAVPIAVQNGMSPGVAVTLAVPVGLLGVLIDYVRRTVNAAWVHMADSSAEKASAGGVMRAHFLYPLISTGLLYVIPVSIAIYLGPDAVKAFMNAVPDWLMHGLEVTGGILPALGFALTINVIGKKEIIPYFLFGFFLFQYVSGVNTIGFAIFGAFLAYLHITFTKNNKEEAF